MTKLVQKTIAQSGSKRRGAAGSGRRWRRVVKRGARCAGTEAVLKLVSQGQPATWLVVCLHCVVTVYNERQHRPRSGRQEWLVVGTLDGQQGVSLDRCWCWCDHCLPTPTPHPTSPRRATKLVHIRHSKPRLNPSKNTTTNL